MTLGQLIRGTHPYIFRSGEWAKLVGTQDDPETSRLCYAVMFSDGAVDWWPVDDEVAGYEFKPAGPAGEVHRVAPGEL